MNQNKSDRQELTVEQMSSVAGGRYMPGKYNAEAIAFLQSRMDAKLFERIMAKGDAREKPYVAARICLSPTDWSKYVWIEQHGSLDDYQP